MNWRAALVSHHCCRPAGHEAVAPASRPAVAWASSPTLVSYQRSPRSSQFGRLILAAFLFLPQGWVTDVPRLPAFSARIEYFRFYCRLPCPIHFRVCCGNGWDTNAIQVYTISQNALVGKREPRLASIEKARPVSSGNWPCLFCVARKEPYWLAGIGGLVEGSTVSLAAVTPEMTGVVFTPPAATSVRLMP